MANPQFVNPIGAGLIPERVDQGVDYGGSGNLMALGSGTITSTQNAGWPGGGFIGLHLDTGNYVFYAEDVAANVKVGQKVQAGQVIGRATGGHSGIEVGWAAPPGTGNTMAMQAGQTAKGLAAGDPGAFPTAYGVDFSKLIQSLGGPPGKITGPIQGTVPAGFDTIVGNVGTTQATTDSIHIPGTNINIPTGAGGLLQGLFGGAFQGIFSGLLKDARAILVRLGLILLGGILVLVGLYVLVKANGDSTDDMKSSMLELFAKEPEVAAVAA